MRRGVVLLCMLGLLGLMVWGQSADLTFWQLPQGSFPGDIHWVSGSGLYVSLENPRGIGLFEPANDRVRVWETPEATGEFEVLGGRVIGALPYVGQLGWLSTDYGMLSTFTLPQGGAWPVRLLNGAFAANEIYLYYIDWTHGTIGLFAPIESGPFSLRNMTPRNQNTRRTTTQVATKSLQVTGKTVPGGSTYVPAVQYVASTVNDPFTEWPVFSPNDPVFGFTRSPDGRIWVGGPAGDPLKALIPWDNTLMLFDLPGAPFIAQLASGVDHGTPYSGAQHDIWFLSSPTDTRIELGVLSTVTGDVITWPVPEAGDPTCLRVIGREVWFTDREISAIYRFDIATQTFDWWRTGGDDAPLYLEPGDQGDIWVTLERKAAIGKLEP